MPADVGPVEHAFAQQFATWGIRLPEPAVRERADGELHAQGWTVRWRWRAGGRLEYRASHRMTNERWVIVEPDGTLSHQPVPSEFMVYGDGDDRAAIEAEYRAAWRAHGETVGGRGMAFADRRTAEMPPVDPRRDCLYRLDGGAWATEPLAPA